MKEKIDILVTIDENYLNPLQVMLTSIYLNNQNDIFKIWLIHQSIPQEKLDLLNKQATRFNWEFEAVVVDESLFDNAKTVDRYPKEMYFRLLAGQILPKELKKVLYLDPDILIINPLRPLWEMDLKGNMLTASTHAGVTNIINGVNNIRLGTDHDYYNSGVMIMDLDMLRSVVKIEDINEVIENYNAVLILPDQDILNFLYGNYILGVPEELWNYDARKYSSYLTRSLGKEDIHWVAENTAVLHFCGQPKPWDEKNDTRFTALYENYRMLTKNYI